MNDEKKTTFVPSELRMRATADLQDSVAEDLDIPDPDKDIAKAVLHEGGCDENTNGDGCAG